jgi:F-type H+-transporting ATPase subunit delta
VAEDRLIKGYAKALLAVAEAEGELDTVEDELYQFAATVEREPRLREALTDPQLPTERKKALLQELLGTRANAHTTSLLGFVVEQGRAKDLERIVRALADEAAERRRHALAEVRAAIPLDDDHRKRLARALAKATGKELELKVLVDPSVIGGVVAQVGDQVFDGTIRRRVELAREQLSQAGAAG